MYLSQEHPKIFDVETPGFESLALEIFRFQYNNNAVYREYVNTLAVDTNTVDSLARIPFLPIQFFKSHIISTTDFRPAAIFESSGTSGTTTSRHYVKDTALYRESFTRSFEKFYGPAAHWCIIGLLPSYLERRNASLVYMIDDLIKQSGHPASGFYLDDMVSLHATLGRLEKEGQPVILIGVTFALLDFADNYPLTLQHTVIMETGGMKGRREEMIREEVHQRLKKAFDATVIHSEYGMTELLSQAYSKGHGLFECPPWMKVVARDEEDPLHIHKHPVDDVVTGALNVIDLANIYSCSFIATDDAVRLHADGRFEVLGRLDNSDLRGCSLMTV